MIQMRVRVRRVNRDSDSRWPKWGYRCSWALYFNINVLQLIFWCFLLGGMSWYALEDSNAILYH